MYFSQAHLYLKGTSWLTSAFELMTSLSSTVTRRSAPAAGFGSSFAGLVGTNPLAGWSARPGIMPSFPSSSKLSIRPSPQSCSFTFVVRIARASSMVLSAGISWVCVGGMNSGRYSRVTEDAADVRCPSVEKDISCVAMYRFHSVPAMRSHSAYRGCDLRKPDEKSPVCPKWMARKVMRRQPGTITAKMPAAWGADQSGARKGPAKVRLPSVITCSPPGSLTGLAFRIVDRAEFRVFHRARARLDRVGGRRHGVQVPGLGG